jgi:hypothetical protein
LGEGIHFWRRILLWKRESFSPWVTLTLPLSLEVYSNLEFIAYSSLCPTFLFCWMRLKNEGIYLVDCIINTIDWGSTGLQEKVLFYKKGFSLFAPGPSLGLSGMGRFGASKILSSSLITQDRDLGPSSVSDRMLTGMVSGSWGRDWVWIGKGQSNLSI